MGRPGVALWAAILGVCAHAAPPPDIPGEDISGAYMEQVVPPDTLAQRAPAFSMYSPNWLGEAERSWDAPPLAVQMGADDVQLPMGKGAVFVPRFTDAALEPEIEVLEMDGLVAGRGKPGSAIPLLPGTYSVVLGSGAHHQQMVRQVEVREGKAQPVLPDWAGLTVDVVNQDNQPFAGDYELVRLDEFDPYGRGLGADPDLGEKPLTWVLRPGVYKIFSVGESYNTLRNFITVRLLPGYLSRILLVIDEEDLKIVGGGIVQQAMERVGDKHWSVGVDVGGSILFNAEIDRRNETDRGTNSSTIALLLNGWLRWDRKPYDWSSSLRLDEGFTIPDFDFEQIENSVDDARLRSLFLWRVLPLLGPYGRVEVRTSVFAEYLRQTESQKYFMAVDESGALLALDSAASFRTEAAFSPFTTEAGLGANVDIIDVRYLEAKFRTGFGYSFTSVRDNYVTITAAELDTAQLDSATEAVVTQSVLLRRLGSAATHEAGPEAALTLNLRLGNWAMVRAEARLFAPVAPELRFNRPDFDLETTLSWRLTRWLTFDYELVYILKQPEDENLRQDLVRHGVRIRYSLRTR